MSSTSTVSHGGTQVYSGMEDTFDDLKDEKARIGEMREQIKNNPDLSDDQKASMLEELDRAEAAVDKGLDFTTKSGKYDQTSGNVRNDGDFGAVEASLSRAEASMRDLETQLAASAQNSPDVQQPPNAGNTSGASGTSGSSGTSGASGASGSGSGSGSSSTGDVMGTGKSMDELMNMMATDPGALFELTEDMDPEQQQVLMQQLQSELQQMNQMFSMMSNMAKSMHDTMKASINNMRV